MFQWDKSISTLDLPFDKVVQLFRSMLDVQLVLPGLPAQAATAYLCQYRAAEGLGTVAVFHLHKSNQMAFYVTAPREMASGTAETMLDQATVFVESMGFLMTDLDFQLLNESDRALLWDSLPLRSGLGPSDDNRRGTSPATPRVSNAAPAVKSEQTGIAAALQAIAQISEGSEFLRQNVPVENLPTVAVPTGQPLSQAAEDADVGSEGSVDDLLAAVEALRTRRPGVGARKKAPGPDELKRRRQELRENLGRVLSSL